MKEKENKDSEEMWRFWDSILADFGLSLPAGSSGPDHEL
jgi:hypothetical protein